MGIWGENHRYGISRKKFHSVLPNDETIVRLVIQLTLFNQCCAVSIRYYDVIIPVQKYDYLAKFMHFKIDLALFEQVRTL